MLKRLTDIVVSLIMLTLLIPFFLIVAILIKLDSKGPIFFTQERVGNNNKLFKAYKFRTMILEVENPPPIYSRQDLSKVRFQQKDDSRITRMGRFLRRGFDELPGLINVLNGEMSLVGPRPEVAEIVELYDVKDRKRLEVKPGITGLSIIHGRGDLTIRQTIDWDLKYVEDQSFLLDMKILLQTLWVVLLAGRGAR